MKITKNKEYIFKNNKKDYICTQHKFTNENKTNNIETLGHYFKRLK